VVGLRPPPLAPIASLGEGDARGIVGVLCDIDDTLTWEGRLVPAALTALERLADAGLRVVPVTGRPAGWVDHIARMWPVDGVVGENGGLWFFRRDGRMVRRFLQGADERAANRARLDALAVEILKAVPGAALASDQPYRELDLAIDFREDVPPLGDRDIDAILTRFEAAGASAKVSSIHVNGWFGAFDKGTGFRALAGELWSEDPLSAPERWLYIGDSANDEPMFRDYPLSVGVANIAHFLPRMAHHPRWVCEGLGGFGFAEMVDVLLARRADPR
jgi:HAD superfamily hydrolase (TIGR01484 family)